MEEIAKYLEIEKQRRTEHLNSRRKEILVENNLNKQYLKIVYIMTSTSAGGGSKIILEQANYLTNRGHKIYIISHQPKPAWFKLESMVQFIQVPYESIVAESIPKDADIIVSTTPSSIYECIEQKIAPVVYFEQGDHHLFDRTVDTPERLDFIKKEYDVCSNIFTVSNYAKERIWELYGKKASVISNAVNSEIFYYEPHEKKSDVTSIVAIGGEDWEFKGIKYILEAVKKLKEKYNIQFTWITPREPNTQIETTLINPKQIEIGNALRNADIYICASNYESFGLPILEAMNCGACVVTTDVGGNRDFSLDNETCLIINKKDYNDIISKVEILIKDEELRQRLVKKALKKASEYNWERTIDELEEYYRKIAKYSVQK